MNTKLTCLLLDDEIPGLAYLKLLCEGIPNLEILRSFNDPLVFLNEYSKYDVDFCILDIEMPKLNGLELAKRINKPVIFATAYKEFAADAFDISAIDYIRKPVKKERLEQAIDKLRKQIEIHANKQALIQLNTNKGKTFLQADSIVLIKTSEIDSRDKIALMNDGKEWILKNYSLEKLLVELPETAFVQINRKEILALKHIAGFGNDFVECQTFKDDVRLILSEVFRKDFLLKVNS